MSSFLRSVLAALASVLVFGSVVLAQADVADKKTGLEKALERLRETLDDKTAVEEVTFPEDTSQRFGVKEIRISGNSLISTGELVGTLPGAYTMSVRKGGEKVGEVYDFRAVRDIIINPGQEREVSLRTIQGLTNYFLSVYQDTGYIGIYVYVPADAVGADGKLVNQILPIEVLEGRVSEVAVERYDFDRQKRDTGYLKGELIKQWSPVKSGDAIEKKKVDDFVGLLNINPDRYVSAVVSRSNEPNALKLGYDVYESNPWHFYVQADDSGTKDRRWSPRVGLINTNLTGMDDRASVMYQAPWERGIEEEYAVFGSYGLPVFSPGLRLNVFGGYSQFDIPALPGIDFLGNGSFYGGMLSCNVFQMKGWFVDVTGSMSHERSRVTPSIGVGSDVDMDLWGAGINIHRSEDLSNTSLRFNRYQSMGGSTRDEFQQSRLETDRNFAIYNFSAAHSRYLDPNKIGRISGSFHLIASSERLIPAKMTTFGGLYSVRGYEEDEIVADGGIIASAQYEFDLVKYGLSMEADQTSDKDQAEKPWLRKFAPLVFVDYGRAKIKDPVVGEDGVQELCSAGTGVIVEVGDNFTGAMYYGWALRGTDDTESGDGQLNLSFIYRF